MAQPHRHHLPDDAQRARHGLLDAGTGGGGDGPERRGEGAVEVMSEGQVPAPRPGASRLFLDCRRQDKIHTAAVTVRGSHAYLN